MKKSFLILAVAFCFINGLTAQVVTKEENEEEEKKGGFKKENLFTGGTVALGFSNGSFSFGLGPYFGYSINKYVDVAASLGYNYVSQRDAFEFDDKLRQSIISPGAFVRLYPVKFLFAHAQYDINFIKLKYIPASGSNSPSSKQTANVSSFLVGPGFANGRRDGSSFSYISLLFDVLKKPNSPYTDQNGRITPIFRAGYNIALFQGSANRSSNNKRTRDYY